MKLFFSRFALLIWHHALFITGEGGEGPSRFKHIIKTESGRYRRYVPIELERPNMFLDNHTFGTSDLRRAFLMGDALVKGIVERIAIVLKERMWRFVSSHNFDYKRYVLIL